MEIELFETSDMLDDLHLYKKDSFKTCNFSYNTEYPNLLIIIDLFTGTEMSLTNCIEEAVKIISKKNKLSITKDHVVLYRDTEGTWDIYVPHSDKFFILNEGIYQNALKRANDFIQFQLNGKTL